MPHTSISSTISDVERDTGLAKETLRVWERRYGFPAPERDRFGDRVYSAEQVARLQLVKRLIDLGYRPGKLVDLDEARLHALAEQAAGAPPAAAAEAGGVQSLKIVSLCKTHDLARLRGVLRQAEVELGLERFVLELAAPLCTTLGACWAGGEVSVFEEHLLTEALQGVLRAAILSLPAPRGRARPAVLLTTFPQERHGLGLLMAEAMLALHGARCMALGVATPVAEVAAACLAQPADIVALSFSSIMPPRQIADGVRDLRARLPQRCAIWAGGAHARFARRADAGVRVTELAEVPAALAAWRAAQAAA